MISRHWRGVAHNDRVEDYIDYLREDTFEKARDIDGFITGHILTRKLGAGTEFLVITEWENMASIREFAGHEPEVAVITDFVKEIMIEYDSNVRHYNMERD